MSTELTREQITAWGKASRAAAGVPPKIEDPAVLGRLVTLALAGIDSAGGESGRRHASRRPRASERQGVR